MSSSLDSPVLVLDKQYRPVKIVSAKEAISVLYSEQEKALVLDSMYMTYTIEEWIDYCKMAGDKNELVVRSSKIRFIVPEVIVLPKYIKKSSHGKRLRYSRVSIFKRDNFVCQYCGKEHERRELTVDHIIPKSKGGKSTWLNIITACRACNWKKADRTPEEAKMPLLSTPRIPSWKDSVDLPAGIRRDLWDNFI